MQGGEGVLAVHAWRETVTKEAGSSTLPLIPSSLHPLSRPPSSSLPGDGAASSSSATAAATEAPLLVQSFQATVSVRRPGGIKAGYCAMLGVHAAHVPVK
jgi:hypothetical protein